MDSTKSQRYSCKIQTRLKVHQKLATWIHEIANFSSFFFQRVCQELEIAVIEYSDRVEVEDLALEANILVLTGLSITSTLLMIILWDRKGWNIKM